MKLSCFYRTAKNCGHGMVWCCRRHQHCCISVDTWFSCINLRITFSLLTFIPFYIKVPNQKRKVGIDFGGYCPIVSELGTKKVHYTEFKSIFGWFLEAMAWTFWKVGDRNVLMSRQNLTISDWITLKLYYKVPYHQRKTGTAFVA